MNALLVKIQKVHNISYYHYTDIFYFLPLCRSILYSHPSIISFSYVRAVTHKQSSDGLGESLPSIFLELLQRAVEEGKALLSSDAKKDF